MKEQPISFKLALIPRLAASPASSTLQPAPPLTGPLGLPISLMSTGNSPYV